MGKTIGVLTSGGDAPGMNAAIRGVVRKAIAEGQRVVGIRNGYAGLMAGDFFEMNISSVADIIQKGGTFLGSARSELFRELEGQKQAAGILRSYGIDALVVLGGNGSLMGAKLLADLGVQTAGVPCTIDNDMGYTDWTIGFHTAVETVIESISRIRDTSSSLARAHIIEVMGRHCGDIALYSGLAGGAETIVVPEHEFSIEEINSRMLRGKIRGKRHHIIVVSEGVTDVYQMQKDIEAGTGVETKITILGYVQRGGVPSFTDATMASILGAYAVEQILAGDQAVAVGTHGKDPFAMPLDEAVAVPHIFNERLYELAMTLSA